jgi:hypothetical protein
MKNIGTIAFITTFLLLSFLIWIFAHTYFLYSWLWTFWHFPIIFWVSVDSTVHLIAIDSGRTPLAEWEPSFRIFPSASGLNPARGITCSRYIFMTVSSYVYLLSIPSKRKFRHLAQNDLFSQIHLGYLNNFHGRNIENIGAYYIEFRNHFLGLKYLNFLMRIRDGDSTVRIRDGKKSDPGSGINIPDPQH